MVLRVSTDNYNLIHLWYVNLMKPDQGWGFDLHLIFPPSTYLNIEAIYFASHSEKELTLNLRLEFSTINNLLKTNRLNWNGKKEILGSEYI